MDYLAAVAAQPENVARVARTVRGALAGLDLDPWREGALGLVAMGAAHHAAQAAVARLRAAGRRATAPSATELLGDPGPDLADAYVAISQSGRSRETVEAMAACPARPRLGLTNEPAAPLAGAVDAVVPFGSMEDSPVYTLGYTATVVACGLLVEALTRTSAGAADGAGWDALPGLVDRVLAASEAPVARAAERLRSARMLDFVGQREHLAAAGEGALLVREGARVPTSSMDTYQYLHGPMEPLEPGVGCVVLGDGREVELARAAAATGATALLITTADVDDAPDPGGNLVVLRLPAADPIQLAVLEALPIQLLTWRLARARGLAIEGFRYRQADTKLDG